MAEQVVRAPAAPPRSLPSPFWSPRPDPMSPSVQRKTERELEEADLGARGPIDPLRGLPEGLDDEGQVQAKLVEARPEATAPGASSNRSGPVEVGGGGGSPLSDAARRYMEPRFDFDFRNVRVHDDMEADHLSRSLGAAAFTYGRHIYFRAGRLDASGEAGRRLLAHELTHVVQQAGGTPTIRRSEEPSAATPPHIQGIAPGDRQVQCRPEVHANLHEPQKVRIYEAGEADVEFTTSAGAATEDLISCQPHRIIAKNAGPTDRWGLHNYSQITSGGIGFHSNRCEPRRGTLCDDGQTAFCTPASQLHERVARTLLVDGTSRSHGCLRLNDGDSAALFSRVSNNTQVFIYARRAWRPPSWSTEADRADGPDCTE